MGYSARKDALDMLNAIAQAQVEFVTEYSSGRHKFGSNVIVNGSALPIGFFERGRENADGAVTGTVMKCVDKDGKPTLLDDGTYAIKVGSFRISPDGEIVRFPLLLKSIRERAEQLFKQHAVTHIGAI